MEQSTNTAVNSVLLFMQQNKFAIIAILGIIFIIFGYFTFRGSKSEIKKESKIKMYARRAMITLRKLYVKLMHLLGHIPVIGDIINNTCYAYKCQEALSEDDAVVRTGRTLLWTLFAFAVMFVAGLVWFGDIIMALITAFMIAHIVGTSTKSNSRKFLINLHEAIEDFLLAYHKSSGNIDAAFYAVSKTNNPVSRHFDVMHEYIRRAFVSETPDTVQAEYNSIAPSRYLRNLYAVIYMTYKYGDQKNDGKSALNVNVMEIQEQIGDALYQTNKLLDETMGERWFIIAPLYAIPLLGDYMLEYFAFEGFEYIESFLTSSTGYMVQTLCAIISLICYLLYAEMVNRGILEVKARANWENKVLRNPYIRRVIYKLLPADSPKRKALQTTMNKAGVMDTVNALQIRRVALCAFLCVVASLSIGLNVVSSTAYINNDIYTGLPRENFSQALLLYDDETDYYSFIDDSLEADKLVIQYLQKYSSEGKTYFMLSEEDQEKLVRGYIYSNDDIADLYREDNFRDYAVTRVMAKMAQLEQVSGLNSALFILLMTIFGYFIPLWMMQLKAYMNKDMLLLDEVTDLQKTTIMLMEYPSTTPDGLLTWYSSSSVLLAPHLRECRVTHDMDALINATNYKPFIQLATSLQMAFDGLPLKEAFSGVEQRLLTQQKEQSRIMERMLSFRVKSVETFTSISMGAVIALYMFMPLLIAMVQMFFSLDVF